MTSIHAVRRETAAIGTALLIAVGLNVAVNSWHIATDNHATLAFMPLSYLAIAVLLATMAVNVRRLNRPEHQSKVGFLAVMAGVYIVLAAISMQAAAAGL